MKDEPRFPTGQRLKEARAAAGFPKAKNFVDRYGVKPGTYSGHEAGTRNLDLETVERYAELLQVRAAWLAFGEEPMKENGSVPEGDEENTPLAERVSQLTASINNLLTMMPASDGYVGVPPLARKLADVIERAGFAQAPIKSEPTSASKP
jgi:transcriptional regulator with XRE-family HTH domain